MMDSIHSEKECGICFMCYGDDHQAVALRCGHVFGMECATEWISLRHNCPVCKSRAKKNQLIKIYNIPKLPKSLSPMSSQKREELRQKLLLRKRRIRELKDENERLKEHLGLEKTMRTEMNKEMNKLRGRIRNMKSTISSVQQLSRALSDAIEEEDYEME